MAEEAKKDAEKAEKAALAAEEKKASEREATNKAVKPAESTAQPEAFKLKQLKLELSTDNLKQFIKPIDNPLFLSKY